ncbi:MAG: hypothetical protein A2787_03910 [Omnitrophica WOR_2 bacterium RIFCSPHIGHO2_01_FULL_48_9]|nr:MAG: hypothetical protein A3D10_06615 [Omnitrophica WOR_2 bacterium RIFCSPHIGHO2_02_FULL_48_11]OGX33528.1 MAG: hypothetical protein A2787_03910 [Omnitrophica WOR_2 bacterium RIFCSPHIGHO2_01_FULL_48_9]
MKRILFFYLGILLGLFVLLQWLNAGGDYAIERELWQINKKYERLALDPYAVPENEFQQAVRDYESLIKRYPRSPVTPNVYLQISEVHALRKNYALARDVLQYAIGEYKDNLEFCAQAMTGVAKTYELENQWEKAKGIYQQIIDKYPLTMVGINTPIYIANHYEVRNDSRGSQEAYQKAIRFYKKTAAEHTNSSIEFNCLRLLANCYFALGQWEEGLEALGEVLLKYPVPNYLTEQRVELITKTINLVAVQRLKEPQQAVRIYKEFIEQYPGHLWNSFFQRMVVELSDYNEKVSEASQEK